MHPLVSIIIPAYNAGAYLRETLDSVLAQAYVNWEAIIVNDGSKDETLAIAQEYAQNDQRFLVIDQNNAGVSTARNNGFAASKGTYLSFLDADDVWDPAFLSARVKVLEESPEVGLVNGNVTTIAADSKALNDHYIGHGKQAVRDILEFAPKVTIPSNLLCRRSVYEQVGGFHPELSNVADKMLFVDIARVSEIVCLDAVHLYYRLHPGSMHHNLELMESDYLRFLQILTTKGLFEEFSQAQFKSRIYKICAGAFRQHGKAGPFLKYLILSLVASPSFWWQFLVTNKAGVE